MDDDLFISRRALADRLGHPDAPFILDVRREARFAPGEHRVAAALRALPPSEPVRDVVVYCVHGHEVSQQAARELRAAGRRAWVLEGGIEGGEPGVDAAAFVARVRAEPLPRVRQRRDLGVTGEAPSQWITRERPRIDRIACPWLVRRFIDPRAVFHFAPTAEVLARARALVAVAFDIPGAPITHVGERCSFDALIDAFELRLPALNRLATIVRGADTDRPDLDPVCAGLLATSLGLARLHDGDDHALLAAGLPVYDALYAWCVAEEHHHNETHTWRPA
ncbi:MAG: chromate resistance protein [Hydrogenophaga sp.]|nr:chromate resistance protein [Hydrogenophaga sp.]